jgi:hypothetical protein
MSKLTIERRDSDKYFSPLIGQKPWNASLGYGHFITIEFGNKIPHKSQSKSSFPRKPRTLKEHGEWHLWIYMCAWRLEQKGSVLAASGDNTDRMEQAIKVLEGMAIESIEIKPVLLDTFFYFENDLLLRTFSVYSDELDECNHWMLFDPHGNVLVAGPANNLSYGDASQNE